MTYLAEIPRGFGAQFKPGINALMLAFYYDIGTNEPKVLEIFKYVGIKLSAGEISNLMIKKS